MFSLISDALTIVIIIMFQIFKATWWIIIPVALLIKINKYLLVYKSIQFGKEQNWTLLEIILPPEVEKTPKAMENVLSGLHGAWKGIDFRDKWQGKSADIFSLEMAGVDGELHFYVRCQTMQRNFVEGKIYAQYPNAEIYEVEDYTIKAVPPDIPNKDYNVWGADYILNKDWPYPILTHVDFEDPEEERRMDPLSQFAEMVSKMQEGEHMWLQLVIAPAVTEAGSKAKEAIDKEVGRGQPASSSSGILLSIFSFFGDIVRHLGGKDLDEVSGKPAQPQQQGMRQLTPGEQEKVKKMEIKASKALFKTTIRAVYVARNDVFYGPQIAALQGFFNQFNGGINGFKPSVATSSSLIFFKDARNFLRKKKLIGAYRGRFLGVFSEPYFLNTEEIATIYHYPGRVVKAPLMPRITSKSSEPPKDLPR